jgi:NlpC/P60 family putative phage cell wall peptidase
MEIDSISPTPQAATPTTMTIVTAARGPVISPTTQAATPTLIISAARSWIGTPYRHQASVKGVGCDCLGLLRGVWRELRGAEPQSVPPYAPDWAEASGVETLCNALARHLTPIALPAAAPGDVLLFRMGARGPANHCAILAARDGALTLIHARQNHQVSEEDFSPAWRRKLAFALRL